MAKQTKQLIDTARCVKEMALNDWDRCNSAGEQPNDFNEMIGSAMEELEVMVSCDYSQDEVNTIYNLATQ